GRPYPRTRSHRPPYCRISVTALTIFGTDGSVRKAEGRGPTKNRGLVTQPDMSGDTEPIGVAVIGAGYWGPNLVRNFQASTSFRLRWLCDLDVNRARKVLGNYSTVETTADYAKVLADETVTAVAIATPAATHKDLALAA